MGCAVFHVLIVFPKMQVSKQVLELFKHLFIGVDGLVVVLALPKNALALLNVEVSKLLSLNLGYDLVLFKDTQVICDCDLTSRDRLNQFLPLSCAE